MTIHLNGQGYLLWQSILKPYLAPEIGEGWGAVVGSAEFRPRYRLDLLSLSQVRHIPFDYFMT